MAESNPAGWPRPVLDGMPVPWITVVAGGPRVTFGTRTGIGCGTARPDGGARSAATLSPNAPVWVMVAKNGHGAIPRNGVLTLGDLRLRGG
ncbi:hypothetical protein GCM10010532_113910 [Dactylosporangium siamense]|uniref:Uncharacterized protein n=1 Tax=Dactylosporangium siamense TaxID=685454 RepID=A0A919PTG6_9ACTN|nr:hypothetical protein Dsi01nite_079300 [Dactylosporangium siamense]